MKLTDETTVKMVKALYKHMMSGRPICDAFETARDQILERCAQEFQIFKSHEHECDYRWQKKEGIRECKSEHIQYKYKVNQARLVSCFDRSDDVFTPVLKELLRDSRLMCL